MSSIDTVLARGNVAVITGGASGIGLAVAEQLLDRGMRAANQVNPPAMGSD
jgi:NAD(P)-dependent dehydrogenase (short-subunit alcohol dehydrogenase family)